MPNGHNGNFLYMYLEASSSSVGCRLLEFGYVQLLLLTFAFSFTVVRQIYKRLPKIMSLLEALISTYSLAYLLLPYLTNAMLMLFSGFKFCSKIVNTYLKRSR